MKRPSKPHEPHASTNTDRWRGETKVDVVWKALKQQFGMRFYDQFGENPSDEWRTAINELATKQLDGALRAIATTAPPYAGWIPTLPDFLAIAKRIKLPDAPQERPNKPVNVGSWVNRLCRGLVMRWTYNLPFSTDKEQGAQMNEVLKEVSLVYEMKYGQLHRDTPPPNDPIFEEIRQALTLELEVLKRQWQNERSLSDANTWNDASPGLEA